MKFVTQEAVHSLPLSLFPLGEIAGFPVRPDFMR